jgi:hypothetical protein
MSAKEREFDVPELAKRAEVFLGATPAVQKMKRGDVSAVNEVTLALLRLPYDDATWDQTYELKNELVALNDSVDEVPDPDQYLKDAEEIITASTRNANKVAAMLSQAAGRVPNWGGHRFLVRVSFNEDRAWDPATSFYVMLVNDRGPGFSVFTDKTGGFRAVDDILDSGDTDFFRDAKIQADYFDLVRELEKPGSTKRGRDLILYTARPTKDRELYRRARQVPINIFLTTDPRRAVGIAHDLGANEVRDVWRVVINSVHLIPTLTVGRMRDYQTVGSGQVPVKAMELWVEGQSRMATARSLTEAYVFGWFEPLYRTAGQSGVEPWMGDGPHELEGEALAELDKEPAFQELRTQLNRVLAPGNYLNRWYNFWEWLGAVYLMSDSLNGVPRDLVMWAVKLLDEMALSPEYTSFRDGWKHPDRWEKAFSVYRDDLERALRSTDHKDLVRLGLTPLEFHRRYSYGERYETPESKAFKQDVANQKRHVTNATRAFKRLLKELIPAAEKAKEAFPGRDKKSRSRRARAFVAAVSGLPKVLSFLDRYIGTEQDDPKASSWRRTVVYVARDVLIAGMTLRDAAAKVGREASKGFQAMTMAEAQAPLKEVVPEQIMAFLPKNIVVKVDERGFIQQVTDRFENEHETLGVKIATMRKLITEYNDVVRTVKADIRGGDEITRMAALITAIIMETGIRPGKPGNATVKVVNGEDVIVETFGAITLGPQHVKFVRENFAELEFVGKKGGLNLAHVGDRDIVMALQGYVENALTSRTPYIFTTSGGRQFAYNDLQQYFRAKFPAFSPTDFRKLRATSAVLFALHQEQQNLYARLREFSVTETENLREKVADEIAKTFEAAIEASREALSHESASTTVRAYINPEVILRFLSEASVGSTLQDTIMRGEPTLNFSPKQFVGLAHYLAQEGATLRAAASLGALMQQVEDLMDEEGVHRASSLGALMQQVEDLMDEEGIPRRSERLTRPRTARTFEIEVGTPVWFGKYKNKRGIVKEFKENDKGDIIVTIQPVPKGRKQEKEMKLFKIRPRVEKKADWEAQNRYFHRKLDREESREASSPAESAALSLLDAGLGYDEAIGEVQQHAGRGMKVFDPVSRTMVPADEVVEALKRLKPSSKPVRGGMKVYHATTPQNAALLLKRGFSPETKPRHHSTTYAPGKGIDPGLYVGHSARTVSGYGRVILEVTVSKSDLAVPTELAQLGETNPMQALRSHDGAVVTSRLPPEAFQVVEGARYIRGSDRIPGGLAKGKKPGDFDQKALAKGVKVEMEHTTDEDVAREIAMDHLTEDPDYYDKLEKIEKQAGVFEAPPAMIESIGTWMKSVYAGHILEGVQVDIERTRDALAPVKRAIEEMEAALRTLSGVPGLAVGKFVKFKIHRMAWGRVEVESNVMGVKRIDPTKLKKPRWGWGSGGPPDPSIPWYVIGYGEKSISWSPRETPFPYTWNPPYTEETVLQNVRSFVQKRITQLTQVLTDPDKITPPDMPKLVELELLKRECLKHTDKAKSYKGKAKQKFDIDLTGWKYVSDAAAAGKKLADAGWSKVNVELDFKGTQYKGGHWNGSAHELNVELGLGSTSRYIQTAEQARSVADFQYGMSEMMRTLRHECQHMGQDLLRDIKGLEEDAGLPGQSIRNPDFDWKGVSKKQDEEGKRTRKVHPLLDVEFYTRLGDEIDKFARFSRKIPLKLRRQAVRVWVGDSPESKLLDDDGNTVSAIQQFFYSLKKYEKDKWRKAVSEFYKGVEGRVKLSSGRGPSQLPEKHGHKQFFVYGDDQGNWELSPHADFGALSAGKWQMTAALAIRNDWRNLMVDNATEHHRGFRRALNEIVGRYPELSEWIIMFDGGWMDVSRLTGTSASVARTAWGDYTFYHGTSESVWEVIQSNGLKPRSDTNVEPVFGVDMGAASGRTDAVYLTTQMGMAQWAANSAARKTRTPAVILEVTGIDPAHVLPDEDSKEETAEGSLARIGSVAYAAPIPAGQIRLIARFDDGWKRVAAQGQ